MIDTLEGRGGGKRIRCMDSSTVPIGPAGALNRPASIIYAPYNLFSLVETWGMVGWLLPRLGFFKFQENKNEFHRFGLQCKIT